MGLVNSPLSSGMAAAAAAAAAAALAFLWNQRCQNQPSFDLLYTGNKYKGLTSVLLTTCTVGSRSARILAVRFICRRSLNDPGHCCNLVAISLSRKTVKASLMDRNRKLQTRRCGKLDLIKMLIKHRKVEEARSAAVATSNTSELPPLAQSWGVVRLILL